MENKEKNKKKITIIVVSILCAVLSLPLIVMPIVTVSIYESIFNVRYTTASWMAFSVDDFDGLQVERSDFESDGVTLAGYKYSKNISDAKGVLVVAHGLGGGGHNSYMPIINYFASNGYYVFSYDGMGNDNSEGKSVRGLPQGIISLDDAINHVYTVEEYKDLPVVLFGHSWGGYSVGNVLNIHPEIKSAVIVSGCNESRDLIEYQGEQFVGGFAKVTIGYVDLYETIKFGKKYTDISAIDGMKNTDAGIMIVHSKDDTTVPTKYGYDKFYKEFAGDNRFQFVLYENKGHNYLFYSDEAGEYREQVNQAYKEYVESHGGEYNAEIKEEFMSNCVDKIKLFEPNSVLMAKILNMYDTYCLN